MEYRMEMVTHRQNWNRRMKIRIRFTFRSIWDIFWEEVSEFINIFVFLPVYITIPYTHFVFFKREPRYNNCLSPSYTIVSFSITKFDENLCNYLSGILPFHSPANLLSNFSSQYLMVDLWELRGLRFFYPSKLAV